MDTNNNNKVKVNLCIFLALKYPYTLPNSQLYAHTEPFSKRHTILWYNYGQVTLDHSFRISS